MNLLFHAHDDDDDAHAIYFMTLHAINAYLSAFKTCFAISMDEQNIIFNQIDLKELVEMCTQTFFILCVPLRSVLQHFFLSSDSSNFFLWTIYQILILVFQLQRPISLHIKIKAMYLLIPRILFVCQWIKWRLLWILSNV